MDDLKTLYHFQDSNKISKQQALIAKINNMPDSNLVYATLKEYYGIHYSRFILGDSLSYADTTALALMADLCPLEYGKVVFKAREILLGEGFREEGDFEDNCLSVEFRNKKENPHKVVEQNDCLIYPNPVQDRVFIRSGFEMSGMQIFNSFGASVYDNNRILGMNHEISLDSFQDGVYYFSIYGVNEEKKFKKVVIIH